MKKLRLELDKLCVESFAAGNAAQGGTVNGHEYVAVTEPIATAPDTGDASCRDSCYFNTCYPGCWTE